MIEVNEAPTVRTRAKFACISATKVPGGAISFNFTAVYSSDPESENGKFWKYTPSGNLALLGTKLPIDAFEPGKEYYLDITPAE